MIEVQDDLRKLEISTDRGLKTAYSRLNPRFELQLENTAFSKHLNSDYLSEQATAQQRSQLVQKLASNNRSLKIKEDVGVLAYLRRNGLEKESNKYNSQQTIDDFETLTNCHPKLNLAAEDEIQSIDDQSSKEQENRLDLESVRLSLEQKKSLLNQTEH